ncbi:hypothetical protein C0992_009549, partial [Termitomyces sp. T32_za158]
LLISGVAPEIVIAWLVSSRPLDAVPASDVDAHDAASLRAYILSFPPQTLHSYTVSHLHPDLDPTTLHHLAAFFTSLVPQPALRCVQINSIDLEKDQREFGSAPRLNLRHDIDFRLRTFPFSRLHSLDLPQTLHSYTVSHLHADLDPVTLHHPRYLLRITSPPACTPLHEIENADRSCLVAHDDESTEVDRVSSKAKGKGMLYETTWSCCGKTVEGDGDMGPPDGRCYEGQHTVHLCRETAIVLTAMQTDTKRARFRADATMHDDKLVSCERLRCGMPPRSTRKRGRCSDDDRGDVLAFINERLSALVQRPQEGPHTRTAASR